MMTKNNKILFTACSFLALIFMLGCSQSEEKQKTSPGNTTYYINPSNGNDGNSGLKEDRAWQTFSRVNQLLLSPGDRVEITSPGSFDQTLMLGGAERRRIPLRFVLLLVAMISIPVMRVNESIIYQIQTIPRTAPRRSEFFWKERSTSGSRDLEQRSFIAVK